MVSVIEQQYVLALAEAADMIRRQAQSAPVFVEIGFGPDRFFIDQAMCNRKALYIGVEKRWKRVVKANSKIQRAGLENAFIVHGDARHIVSCFPLQAVSGYYINFPDPFHKRRHVKRRLLDRDFFIALNHTLAARGFVFISSDHEGYMADILHLLRGLPHFLGADRQCVRLQAGLPEGFPLTEFARRTNKGGGAIQHVQFVKA